MAQQNVPMDTSTDSEGHSHPLSSMTTRSSARLAEKLKQLMETATTSTDLMEYESEELKKRTRATEPKDTACMTQNGQAAEAKPPEEKRSRNGATPLPAAALKASYEQSRYNLRSKNQSNVSAKNPSDNMESIEEEDQEEALIKNGTVQKTQAENAETKTDDDDDSKADAKPPAQPVKNNNAQRGRRRRKKTERYDRRRQPAPGRGCLGGGT